LPTLITIVGTICITAFSAIHAGDFIFARSPGVRLNDPIHVGRLHLSALVFYGIAFCCWSAEGLLFSERTIRFNFT
jgi:hypothetical protein